MTIKAIGGYFELELFKSKEYHQNAIRLNSGRNAFEYILLSKQYKKVYIPYFTCEVIIEPLLRNGISYEFYNVDSNLEPRFRYSKIESDSAFLYTNYFGLKDKFVASLKAMCKNLIIDNAQAFFAKPLIGLDTFYSARKFFGVSDGAYLYTHAKLEQQLERDKSYSRFDHLLKRIDLSPEDGYIDFILNDQSLENNPIRTMSFLTSKILSSIDYGKIASIRKENFKILHNNLAETNKLKLDLSKISVPMVYPYWTTKKLKTKLLAHKIYTATYWPNVVKWAGKESLETKLTNEIIHLPIDQRQTKMELDRILKIMKA